jgi:hypothetical protein
MLATINLFNNTKNRNFLFCTGNIQLVTLDLMFYMSATILTHFKTLLPSSSGFCKKFCNTLQSSQLQDNSPLLRTQS